jgi:hypothetical protein
MNRLSITCLALALSFGTAIAVQAKSPDYDGYSIMVPEKGAKRKTPEPWLAPEYKSPHGTRKHVKIPRPSRTPERHAVNPPPIYVPQTGRVLPNLPTVSGSGPGGSETYQDRAVRCAHQAGAYGTAATGNRTAYIGSCINQ